MYLETPGYRRDECRRLSRHADGQGQDFRPYVSRAKHRPSRHRLAAEGREGNAGRLRDRLGALARFLRRRANPGRGVRNTMVDIINACGYVGLAAVIEGQASTSPSRVWFENGRLFMSGLGNKSGWAAMRRIPGIVTPRNRGDRSPYSAPATEATAFLANVRRY